MSIKINVEHFENHKVKSVGFLRAAVLGANDGLLSTSSLIIGVASSGLTKTQIIASSIAGMIAGAMSMAAGEYISVSSQADTEKADIQKEKIELFEQPQKELEELKNIYIQRGLSTYLAGEVAKELTARNPLEAHVRDELGILEAHKANPLQAAIASATTFALGALFPIVIIFLVNLENLVLLESLFSLVLLLIMGGIAAKAGGANILRGAVRVFFWGAVAMLFTACVGNLFETSIF